MAIEGSPEAAVDADHLTGDVARRLRREKRDDRGHLVRLAGAADRHAFDMLGARRGGHHPEHLGLDEAGRDGVDEDAASYITGQVIGVDGGLG